MFELAFNLQRTGEHKVAKFFSASQVKAYVDAECADLLCKQAWYEYQACKTLDQRKAAAKKLDAVRWSFYKKRWQPQSRGFDNDNNAA